MDDYEFILDYFAVLILQIHKEGKFEKLVEIIEKLPKEKRQAIKKISELTLKRLDDIEKDN